MSAILSRLGLRPEQVKRAMVKQFHGSGCGRRGAPDYVVAAIAEDYRRLRSTYKVAKIYGRSPQAIHEMLKRRGLTFAKKPSQEKFYWGGRCWTPGKDGRLRETRRRLQGQGQLLHRAIWEQAHGPTPPGHSVCFLDGDPRNFEQENLFCGTRAEVQAKVYARMFPDRAGKTPAEMREFWKKYNRDWMRERSAAFKARGLRSDGLKMGRGQCWCRGLRRKEKELTADGTDYTDEQKEESAPCVKSVDGLDLPAKERAWRELRATFDMRRRAA